MGGGGGGVLNVILQNYSNCIDLFPNTLDRKCSTLDLKKASLICVCVLSVETHF